MRSRIVLATKAAGPVRGYEWLRNGSADVTADDIVASCDDSLQRLRTEVIDLYQLHWPTRNVPMFGSLYFDPKNERAVTPIDEQLRGLQRLVQAGKVRHVGVSNETPWGVTEFVRLADAAGLPRIASVQNAYSLVNRSVDNGLDEVLQRDQVSLLAYSPLAFGALSGKYDGPASMTRRCPDAWRLFASMRKQRWGRPEALAAARRYNALAREHGLTPDADGAGLLLPQLARRQHHHRRDHAGAARREPRRLGHRAVARVAGRHRSHPLGAARPGAVGRPWRRRNATSARRRPRHGCAGTAWPTASTPTTTSTTAAPPNRRASSAWTSTRS